MNVATPKVCPKCGKTYVSKAWICPYCNPKSALGVGVLNLLADLIKK